MTTTPASTIRSPHAGEPITDDDAAIAAALEDVSIPALMLSMVHMTGDPSIIRGELGPQGLFLNEVQGFMSEEGKAEVRRRAVEIIAEHRDRRGELPPAPSRALIQEMMSWLVCEPVPDEYVDMMLEELDLDGSDPRRVDWSAVSDQAKADLPVVIIGAGMSGLLAGIRLTEAGVPFTIIEKNAGAGGTWFENRYPGARVDVGNHFYCYSFEPSDHWSEFFSRAPELRAYFDRVMRRYGVDDHIRWETEVTAARWDDDRGWVVETRAADGSIDMIEARALISAVGQLNRPKLPAIEGIDQFAGPSFHTARWDHDVDLAGKRVAVIGAGASGFQVVPTIAPDTAHLTVFQRTAQWMFPNPHYHEAVGEGVQWALRHLPFYGRWYRFLLFWPGCDGALAAVRVDPDFEPAPEAPPAISEVNDLARGMFTEWITDQVGDDPDLLAQCIPDYPAMGKRVLQDNGSWLQALRRDDVELVRTPIERITATGVLDADGTHHEVDVIVFATGFHADRFLWPIEIVGREGRTLAEHWDERPSAYLGITVPGFPNLFCMYGPGTNLAHGGSLIFHSECEMRYIEGCLKALALDEEHDAMEPRPEVERAYFDRLQTELAGMVWSQPSIEHSWYKAADGHIYGLSPWRLVDFWDWTREPDLEDFILR
jgi:4-hydroxyacetophenone monooxygenase